MMMMMMMRTVCIRAATEAALHRREPLQWQLQRHKRPQELLQMRRGSALLCEVEVGLFFGLHFEVVRVFLLNPRQGELVSMRIRAWGRRGKEKVEAL
mmetsp:Transcript_31136/g.66980  ORF Transcript_31136/g.66980 Transcript_31136/m.66980 type:complete len:97 (+) Transcript_31136:82-372(+)